MNPHRSPTVRSFHAFWGLGRDYRTFIGAPARHLVRHCLPAKLVSGLLLLVLLAGMGCTYGPLRIDERYYLSATDGKNTNHYRVSVKGNTKLSEAQFRQGWFPADAVDALFGEVSEEDSGGELQTRQALKKQINETLVEIRRQYYEELKDPNRKDDDKLKNLLQAANQLRLVAEESYGRFYGTITMEYDPASSLVTSRHGDKLLFILSADPDQIIQDIAKFAEDQKTQAVIHNFTKFVVDNARKEVDIQRAELVLETENDRLIAQQMDSVVKKLVVEGVTKNQLAAELEALEALVRQIQNGGQ